MGGLLQVNYLGEMQQRLVQENALSLSNEDLDIIRQVKTNLYVNFQELPWNAGGLQKTLNTLTAQDLHEYQQFDHLTQLHECLYYLANV